MRPRAPGLSRLHRLVALLVLTLLLLLLLLGFSSSLGSSQSWSTRPARATIGDTDGSFTTVYDDNNPSEPLVQYADVCDTPEFAPGALQLNVTIIAFAWRRMPSLVRLITSLKRARYCNRTVPLRMVLDSGALPEVVDFVRGLDWPYGPKEVVEFDRPMGIRGMWINSSRADDLRDDEHVLPLEDDIEVSPLFYWWLLRAASAYGDFDDGRAMRAKRLVGVSLYTPRLNEIVYPQVRWLPDKATAANAFLLQVPCSWGALYLGSMWRDFVRFYRARARPPFFNFTQEAHQRGVGKNREPLGDPAVLLPRSRSNVWPRSWKRFMVDYMYGRGYVMLYPNMRHQQVGSPWISLDLP